MRRRLFRLMAISVPSALVAALVMAGAVEVWTRLRWNPLKGTPGFFLSDPDPTRGLDHFWRAFDLSEGTDVKMRLDLLEAIGAQLPSLRGSARDAQRVKLQAVAQSTDPSISKKAKRLLQSL